MNIKKIYFVVLPLIVLQACRKPYDPPVTSNTNAYLVVEGVINPGADSTTITLSYTVNISSKVTVSPVLNAAVAVESDQSAVYPLNEKGAGQYISPGLNLDTKNKYRLSIKTTNGKQYYSDFVPVINTPSIDSVGFNIISSPAKTGIQLYVNTHDATNAAKYFLWSYSEEWQFYTKYVSNFISNGTAVVRRQPSQFVTYCFAGGPSSNIILGSSAKLTQNVIYQSPLIFIPSTSEKIEDKYSILVKQYALTADAYTFYTNMKQNTENLGSIFDAQPSSTPGNIRCSTNPAEPVVGYVNVSAPSEKRIFIAYDQLPHWLPDYPYVCQQDTMQPPGHSGVNIGNLINDTTVYAITIGLGPPTNPAPYLFVNRPCADCTIRGTLKAPSYWK